MIDVLFNTQRLYFGWAAFDLQVLFVDNLNKIYLPDYFYENF